MACTFVKSQTPSRSPDPTTNSEIANPTFWKANLILPKIHNPIFFQISHQSELPDVCKVHIFWEGHKIFRNLHLTFDCMFFKSNCQRFLGVYYFGNKIPLFSLWEPRQTRQNICNKIETSLESNGYAAEVTRRQKRPLFTNIMQFVSTYCTGSINQPFL